MADSAFDELLALVRSARGQVVRAMREGHRAVPAGVPTAVVGRAIDDAPRPRAARTLAMVREELGDCQRCKLASKRTQLVFGAGFEQAPLMFVGQGPGEQEDRAGEPFVGPAGELLTNMIRAMGWSRAQVYIANIVKCRPPDHRNPEADEVAACLPFLAAQIDVIAPRIIVALGQPASNFLLGNQAPLSALRGKFHRYNGIAVMPTFHPAHLLRSPENKREAWQDLQTVMAELAHLGIAPQAGA